MKAVIDQETNTLPPPEGFCSYQILLLGKPRWPLYKLMDKLLYKSMTFTIHQFVVVVGPSTSLQATHDRR